MRRLTKSLNMPLEFIFDFVLVKYGIKNNLSNFAKKNSFSSFLVFSAHSILSLSWSKQKLFENVFLSKCSELKALQTLKVLSKSETTFVRRGWDPVEIAFT